MLDRLLALLMRPWVMRGLGAFERRYRYDMRYARELFEASPRAFLQLNRLFAVARFAPGLSPAMLAAAKFAATRREDCGPCSQLALDMAREAGVPPALLRALVAGDENAMSADMRRAWRYAQAALDHDAALPVHAEALRLHHGASALSSLALALTVARCFPALKYALGHGQSCQRLVINEKGLTP